MAKLNIKNKRSKTVNKAPAAGNLTPGEIGVNYNTASPALYIEDDGGNVVKLAGAGSVSSPWIRDSGTIHPAVAGDDVGIGGTLPSAPNITLADTGAITAKLDATINNLTVGRGSGNFSTNTAVGWNALLLNTTGTQNTAIGRNALAANTEGQANMAFGRNTLQHNTTGDGNTGVGQGALSFTVTGTNNTAIGRGAGFHIEGSHNTIIGAYSGTSADSTLNDTVIISAGTAEKLRIDSTGSLLFGGTLPSAPNITLKANGEIITNADATIHSLTVGRGSGNITTNTAVGNGALFHNTTGSANTAIGRSALNKNTTGSENVAVGGSSLQNLTSGANNTFIGSFTGPTTVSDTISLAAGQNEKLRIDSTGSLLFGGTLPGKPSITLTTDGNIHAVGLAAAGRVYADNTTAKAGDGSGAVLSYELAAGTNFLTLGDYPGLTPSGGSGTGLTVTAHVHGPVNRVDSLTITAAGSNYLPDEVLTILGTDLGGASPADDVTFKVFVGLANGDFYRKADGTLMVAFT